MTEDEAVAALDAMVGDMDNAAAHIKADEVLLMLVPKAVADAYERLSDRVTFWYE